MKLRLIRQNLPVMTFDT